MTKTDKLSGQKIAVLVDNRCIADTRVIKISESLVKRGAEVRVFCREAKDVPNDTVNNGVRYVRSTTTTLKSMVGKRELAKDIYSSFLEMPFDFYTKIKGILKFLIIILALFARREFQKRFRVNQLPLKKLKGWRHRVKRRLKAVTVIMIALILSPFLLPVILWRAADRTLIQRMPEKAFSIPSPIVNAWYPKTPTAKKKRLIVRFFNAIINYDSDSFYCARVQIRAARLYRNQRSAILEFDPDIIHANDLINLPVASLLKRHDNYQFVYDSHELESERDKPRSRFWKNRIVKLERHFIGEAHRVVTVTNKYAEHLASIYPIEKPAVVYNAPTIVNAEAVGSDIRKDVGLKPDQPLVLYIGSVRVSRAMPLFVEAVSKLPGFHFVAVGPCTPHANEVMHTWAEELGMSERLHILPPVRPFQVINYVGTADISFIPAQATDLSYKYAAANKFFESSLAGVPLLVGVDIEEMAEITLEHNLGITMQQDDPEKIAEAMKELYANRKKFTPTKAELTRRQKLFGWEAQEVALLELYRNVLGLTSS